MINRLSERLGAISLTVLLPLTASSATLVFCVLVINVRFFSLILAYLFYDRHHLKLLSGFWGPLYKTNIPIKGLNDS